VVVRARVRATVGGRRGGGETRVGRSTRVLCWRRWRCVHDGVGAAQGEPAPVAQAAGVVWKAGWERQWGVHGFETRVTPACASASAPPPTPLPPPPPPLSRLGLAHQCDARVLEGGGHRVAQELFADPHHALVDLALHDLQTRAPGHRGRKGEVVAGVGVGARGHAGMWGIARDVAIVGGGGGRCWQTWRWGVAARFSVSRGSRRARAMTTRRGEARRHAAPGAFCAQAGIDRTCRAGRDMAR
jgi:hypothetical protein